MFDIVNLSFCNENLVISKAFFGGVGTGELLIILVILLLIFGAGKLPEVGSALAKTLKGFKKELTDSSSDDS